MEKKTKEEILDEICPNRPWQNGGKTDGMIKRCMQTYADQETESGINKYVFDDLITESYNFYGWKTFEEYRDYWYVQAGLLTAK